MLPGREDAPRQEGTASVSASSLPTGTTSLSPGQEAVQGGWGQRVSPEQALWGEVSRENQRKQPPALLALPPCVLVAV